MKLNKPVDNFSKALNEALRNRYSKVPSAAFLMNEFNSRAYGTNTINRETARKWLKGLVFPKATAIQILVDWLNINPSYIYAMADTDSVDTAAPDQDKVRIWHERRSTNQLALDALKWISPKIAVLDLEGTIVLVNQAWRDAAFDNSSDGGRHLCEGINYLTVCESITSYDKAYGQVMAKGIRDVIANPNNKYSLRYPCYTHKEKRWHTVKVLSYLTDKSRIIVVYLEPVGDLEE